MHGMKKRPREDGQYTSEASAQDSYHSDIARHYDARAADASLATAKTRQSSAAAPVRVVNNFVKSCAIEAAVQACVQSSGGTRPRLTVADIALGRGQDCAKWAHAVRHAGAAPLQAFYGLDLSAGDVAHARELAAKFLPDADTVDIRQMDMCERWSHIPSGTVDIASCQLALHYACTHKSRVAAVCAEAARILRPARGIFIVSFADGRSIVRRARDTHAKQLFAARQRAVTTLPATSDSATSVPAVQADADAISMSLTVAVHAPYYSFTIPVEHIKPRIPSPFGCMYTFTLPGCVEGVAEALCSEGAVCSEASRTGLALVTSMYFDQAILRCMRHPYFASVATLMTGRPGSVSVDDACRDAAAMDAANLYRVCVFTTAKPGGRDSQDGIPGIIRRCFAE